MSQPVLQVTMDEKMYLELLKFKAEMCPERPWNESSDFPQRLQMFAMDVIAKSHVFMTVDILSPFDINRYFPEQNKKSPPKRAPATTGKEAKELTGESVKDYV